LLGIALLRVVLNFLDLLAISLIAGVVALIAGGEIPIFGKLVASLPDPVPVFFTLAAALFAAKSILGIALARLTYVVLVRIEIACSMRLVASVFGGNLSTLKRHSKAEADWLIIRSANIAFTSVLGKAIDFIAEAALALSIISVFFYVDWLSALAIISYFVIVISLFQLLTYSTLKKKGREFSEGTISSGQAISDSFTIFREMFVGNRRHFFSEKIRQSRVKVARAQGAEQYIASIPRVIVELALIIGALGLVSLDFLRSTGSPNYTLLAVFLVGSLRIMSSLLPLQRSFASLRYLRPQAATAQILLRESTHDSIPTDPDTTSLVAQRDSGLKIDVDNVWFSYEDSGKQSVVLEDVSLKIEPGSLVALVGPSGAGKSTLVDIILTLIEPAMGSVFYDDTVACAYRESFPGTIAYVPQKPGLVSGTIRENVAAGIVASDIDDERVMAVLRQSEIYEFVAQLPLGIYADIGKHLDSMSGGQLQRIGLARALYPNPRLLVLDEATSALDAETEAEISQTFMKLRGKTTIIVVAHRLSTIQHADNVYVLDQGKVVASGRFSELRKTSTLVRKFVDLMSFDV